jgi:selenide,water dikinase
MVTLNKLGEPLSRIQGVTAMTDVTGFGLLGHLTEMCEGSGLSAIIEFDKVPVIPGLMTYLEQGCIPGGTGRNWASYGSKIRLSSDTQQVILADPQTSGGLLIAVDPAATEEVEQLLRSHGLPSECCRPFGQMTLRDPVDPIWITVKT